MPFAGSRLKCKRSRNNEVRLQLHALAIIWQRYCACIDSRADGRPGR